ncbi:MAG TPA: molybdopterin molybdotransferase MoeA [Methanocella sp.]|nr:molybdopterin molybdotransferase MoeA [Methanocella sp.]
MPDVNIFIKLTSVEDALKIFLDTISPIGRKYMVELEYADNRVLASDIIAPKDYPHYDQCFMDGYAVVAGDTQGCSQARPKFLALTDGSRVSPGRCVQVHTGSALPEGADAVVRLEDAEVVAGGIRVLAEAPGGQFFTPRGNVVKKGDTVFIEGRQLKPTDIAMLATLGLTEVEVYERPKVLVIPTGDELIERGKEAGPGAVNESNGLMCYLYARRFGGKASVWDIVPDDAEKLKDALRAGLKYDLIVTSGGSSVGKRDYMRELVESMGTVLVHGVGLKPGRPTGMGYIEEGGRRVPIVFLPGFPDACAVGAMAFVSQAIRMLGHYPPLKYPSGRRKLSAKIKTFAGAKAVSKVLVRGDEAIPVSTVGPSPYPGEYAYVVLVGEGHEAGEETEAIYYE